MGLKSLFNLMLLPKRECYEDLELLLDFVQALIQPPVIIVAHRSGRSDGDS